MIRRENVRWMIILYNDNIALASFKVYEHDIVFKTVMQTLGITHKKFDDITRCYTNTGNQINTLWNEAQKKGYIQTNTCLNLFLDNLRIFQVDEGGTSIKEVNKNDSSWFI